MSRRNTTFWSKVGETGVGEMGIGKQGPICPGLDNVRQWADLEKGVPTCPRVTLGACKICTMQC